ncbi:hypothetical protein ILP92_14305 [Maribius pontilimi]|uniref:Uncharacterized protein n=1 Tax=Palleronia pontilimi TaxID=1964209 RepID=A0A934MEY1_9RHOB|nr:hypothetical protein [Palleronia pontilimi]MBJ3763921.1 hypothetical protein [Palleronia pontilimi]
MRRLAYSDLPLENNWKPYWGTDPDARIIHFHGPKAQDIRVFQRGGDIPSQAHLVELWQRDPDAYETYAKL